MNFIEVEIELRNNYKFKTGKQLINFDYVSEIDQRTKMVVVEHGQRTDCYQLTEESFNLLWDLLHD